MYLSHQPRIRIALVLEATIGGTREHLRQIARRINLRRFEVTVICSALRDPGFLRDVETMRKWGLRVILLPMHREIRPGQDFLSLLWLCRHFIREGYDVVHTHSSKAGILGRIGASISAVPHIFHTPHTFAFQSPLCTPARAAFYRFLERFAALFTEKMILLSEAQRQAVLRAGLLNESRTILIPNGISVRTPQEIRAAAVSRKELGLAERERVVGCVGRLTAQKGHDGLLAAAQIVCQKQPEAAFLLVGDGERRVELEKEVSRFGLDKHVRFLGHREDVLDLYPVFDVLALTSHYEGMPYVLLEAMACGCPVVAYRLPELEEVVLDGKTGLLAAPGRPDEIADRILRLLGDEGLRKQMGREARQRVEEHYTAERFINALEALYTD